MCMICIELDKLTTLEAVNNLAEIIPTIDIEHAADVILAIAVREAQNVANGNVNVLESTKALDAVANLLERHPEIISAKGTDVVSFTNELRSFAREAREEHIAMNSNMLN